MSPVPSYTILTVGSLPYIVLAVIKPSLFLILSDVPNQMWVSWDLGKALSTFTILFLCPALGITP